MAKVKYNVSLPITFLREGKKYVAYSPALDLSTSGDSFDIAKKRFTEAVDIFIKETTKKGTLEEALQELGWKKTKKEWHPPAVVGQDSEEVKIPT